MIFNSLTFWTLVAGLLAFVAKFFYPAFPLDNQGILDVLLFLLGLVNIVPTARLMGATFGDLLKSLSFWTMLAGLVAFVLHFFFPAFPLDEAGVLGVIIFLLGLFQIKPELKMRAQLLGKK